MAKNFRSIEDIVKSFSKLNVLIIGDVILDAYLWGHVDRISPEAPVPIIAVTKRENRLGGAANVAINIQSLGATPLLCSVVGNDAHSKTFIELMFQIVAANEKYIRPGAGRRKRKVQPAQNG